MSTGDLYDVGLQPERTELAWRRTALAIATGSLVACRLLPDLLHDPRWVAPGLCGVTFAVYLWAAARRRYQAFVTRTREGKVPGLPSAWLLLTLTGFANGCGFLSLLFAIGALDKPQS